MCVLDGLDFPVTNAQTTLQLLNIIRPAIKQGGVSQQGQWSQVAIYRHVGLPNKVENGNCE